MKQLLTLLSSVSADFGVPIALKVGLTTANGCARCEASLGIEAYPHITATARFGIEASAGGEEMTGLQGGIKTINGCKGISTALTFGNHVALVFNGFGFASQNISLHKIKDQPLHSWCLGQKTTTRRSIDLPEYNLHNYPRDGLDGTSTNGTLSNDTDIVDLTHYVVSDIAQPVWEGVDAASHSFNLGGELDDYWYTTVVYAGPDVDLAKRELLVTCNDGNIYMQQDDANLDWYQTCSSLWGSYKKAVLSSGNAGVLYYYHNTMDKTGVSRVRVADAGEVPDTAAMV